MPPRYSRPRLVDVTPFVALAPRQAQVARLAAQGTGFREIARTLRISPHTVRRTLEVIGRRLTRPAYPQHTIAARCAAWVYTMDQRPDLQSDAA